MILDFVSSLSDFRRGATLENVAQNAFFQRKSHQITLSTPVVTLVGRSFYGGLRCVEAKMIAGRTQKVF